MCAFCTLELTLRTHFIIKFVKFYLALAKDRIEALEREVDVLKAQNAALSRTHEEFSKSNKDGAGGSGGGRTEGGEYKYSLNFLE